MKFCPSRRAVNSKPRVLDEATKTLTMRPLVPQPHHTLPQLVLRPGVRVKARLSADLTTVPGQLFMALVDTQQWL